jgi:hypothetical protein
VEVEPLGGVGPLALQVRGGRDHHEPAPRVLGQVLADGGQRERGLPRPGRRDRQEVRAAAGAERVEGRLLPAAESDLLGHAQRRTLAPGTDTDEFRGRHRS